MFLALRKSEVAKVVPNRSALMGKANQGMAGMRRIHRAQTIKGNQTGTFHVLSGFLVPYQCGEAVMVSIK